MDIKAIFEELNSFEKEKSKMELLQAQFTEKQDALAKRMAALGINPQDLDSEVRRLEKTINEKLETIRKGPAKTQTLKSKNSSADDEIISSILEE